MIHVRAATLLVVSVVTALASPPAVAQVAPPMRDGTTARAVGASITGRIVTDEAAPKPVRRAKVTLSSVQAPAPAPVFTDDEGRYVVADIPAGVYTVAAERSGYLTGRYGSKRAGSTQTIPVNVADGQAVTGVDIRLARWAVITGTVRTPSGQPAPEFQVQALPAAGVSIEDVNGAVVASSDDRGMYRLYGLSPGEYLVVARPAFVRRIEASSSLRASNVAASAPPSGSPPTAYAPVFHPGAVDASQATAIRLSAGEERTGVDITALLLPLASVGGRLVDVLGQPVPKAIVQVHRIDAAQAIGVWAVQPLTSQADEEGRFLVPRITPGHYRVSVSWTPGVGRGLVPRPAAPATIMDEALDALSRFSWTGAFWAQQDVVVDGRDIDRLELRLQPTMTLSGRVVAEGAPLPARELVGARVMVAPIPDRPRWSDLTQMMAGVTMANIKEDGTFEVQSLVPGSYGVHLLYAGLVRTVPVAAAPSPVSSWMVKSVTVAGRDVSDAPFDVRPGENIAGVVITMTDRISEIAGRVIDGAGRPAPGYPIVVFSTDRRYWTFGSRRIQQSRPASDGRYRISGLPAGEYYVCAATEVTALELYTPEFLEQLVAGSFRITLGDGERKIQDMKLGSGGYAEVRRVGGCAGYSGAAGTGVRRVRMVRQVRRVRWVGRSDST